MIAKFLILKYSQKILKIFNLKILIKKRLRSYQLSILISYKYQAKCLY